MIDPLEAIFPIQYRVTLVVLFFSVQGYRDWRKNPENPTRLKEYVFLLCLVFLGMAYGIFHDMVTASLSREYFVIGKGIGSNPDGYYLRVCWLAIKATYWMGLLVAIVLLSVNNPSKKYPQLSYRELSKIVSVPLFVSMISALTVGALFYWQVIDFLGPDETVMLRNPRMFRFVWGIHYGSYVGGFFGLGVGGYLVFHFRKKKLGRP